MNWICVVLFIIPYILLSNADPTCNDFLMKDVCQSYYDFGQCYLYQAKLNCRKTCKVCGDGWATWSVWSLCSSLCDGIQTRTRLCLTKASHCPGEDLNSQTCDRDGARCDGSDTETETEILNAFIPDDMLKHVCDDNTFRCSETSTICILNKLICDGNVDCPNGFDENYASCSLAVNSNSTFQIKNELMQTCFEVITDDPLGPIDGVRSYRRCSSDFSPHRNKFLWRWWKGYNLINLHTGKCLTADDPRRSAAASIRVETCNEAMPTQHWMCHGTSEDSFLIRPRELVANDGVPRFINLGDDNLGWPLVFSLNKTSMKSFWHKGPKEPPESICDDLQVHWSYWSSWSECSLTCGNGRRTRSKDCVNGVAGIPPCTGSDNEVVPCNTEVSCRKSPGLHHNSQCREDFVMLINEQKPTSRNILDPSCYRIFGIEEPATFDEARESCKNHRSTLGSIKTVTSQQLVRNLLGNTTVSTEMYIGVEESFTALPVLSHQFRFLFDNLTIGSFAPWKEDCITGLGSDYRGKRSVAYDLKSGKTLKCQRWNVNTPHRVNYKPLAGDDARDYCRNPNLDLLGPWCYTLDPDVETAYCNIPQCAEHLAPFKLNEEFFQIRRIRKKKVVISNQTDVVDGDGDDDGLCVAAEGIKRFDQLGKPAEIWVKMKECEKLVNSVIHENQRFVWDVSRRRILHENSMLCLSAVSQQAGAGVMLEMCSAEKATQRWRVDGKFVILDVFNADEILHLDIGSTGDDLVVTDLGLRGWTITISSGYRADWLGLRKAYRDESFELYHTSSKRCLAVSMDEVYEGMATLQIGTNAMVGLLPCASSPQFHWMRHPTSPNLLLHIQTSLCLTAVEAESGAEVSLRVCEVTNNLQWWSCGGYRQQNIAMQGYQDLVLSHDNNTRVIVSSVKHNAYWIGWGSRNRTACQFEVASGDSIRGQEFAIRHQQSGKCLKHDSRGSLYLEKCVDRGDPSDEVWSFTQSPTMIRNVVSGKCIRAQTAIFGSGVMVYKCRSQDVMQHWTLHKLSAVDGQEDGVMYYSLHLVANPDIAVTVDGLSGRLTLQEHTEVMWEAIGQNGKGTSIVDKSDCAVYADGVIYYAGTMAVSKSGRRCLKWSETRIGQVYPELESNYCRNPGRNSIKPWCYVLNEYKIRMKDDCGIPACSPVKVKVDPNGKWIVSTGSEKLPYLCQAESECYRGIGIDYVGSWNATMSGYCAAWKDHKESGFEKNYCRNPNSAETGPWCYIYKTKATKVTCPIPKCHKTSTSPPSNVYHGDLIYFKYSASSFGAEEKTLAVKRCHKGYWINKDVFVSQTLSNAGEWKPELDACKVVSCSVMNITVEGAVFSSSSAILYNQHTYFTCQPGLLAGPGQAKISFRCNDIGEWINDNLNADKCLPGCDDGWIPFRQHCYKEFNSILNYTNAKESCEKLDGSLPDIDDKVAFDFLLNFIDEHGTSILSTYWTAIENIWDSKSNKIADRNYRSINHVVRETLSTEKGVGYLPLIYRTFQIQHTMHVATIPHIAKTIPYDTRCMFGYDHTDYVISRGCDDYEERRLLWTWISPFHLYHIGTKKCLTGSPMNGNSEPNQGFPVVTLQECITNNRNQYITCKRGGEASLKLMHQTESYLVDDPVSQLWDKVVIGNKQYHPNASYWTTDNPGYGPCHWTYTTKGNVFLLWEGTQALGQSYTNTQAEQMCQDFGARLATKSEVEESVREEDISACSCAWIDGRKQITAQNQITEGCGSTAGVQLCTNQPKADAFCFRGERRNALDVKYVLVLSTADSALREVSEEELNGVICRKESRWHCPTPTPIPRAIIEETTSTSYSYLGYTTYTCRPGYWFSRGVYSKVVRCNYKLQWDPDPSSLSCEPLHCSQPPKIPNSELTVNSIDIYGTALYECHFGYQFSWSIFKLKVTCSEDGQWDPTPSWQQCQAVTCKNPPTLAHADSVIFSLSYPYNTTYTCHEGYWIGPNVFKMNTMCDGDGYWKPHPDDIICLEIVCLAFKPPQNMILERINVKNILMRCDSKHYLMHNDLPIGENVSLICQDDATWSPDPDAYSCKATTCEKPADVPLSRHAIPAVTSLSVGTKVEYSCIIGTSMHRTFTPYNPLHGVCLYREQENGIYASKQSCGTIDVLTLQWYNGTMLRDVKSDMCLATLELATLVDYKQNLVLKICYESDISQRWHCGSQGAGTLYLGAVTNFDVFVSIRDYSGKAFVTHDKEWLEWIDFVEKDSKTEHELCKYQKLEMKQTITCSSTGNWIPDPQEAIHCVPLYCNLPTEITHSSHEILDNIVGAENVPYATAVKYTCNEGYAFFHGRNSFITRCTQDGRWAPNLDTLSCQPMLCPRYTPPTNSIITKGSLDEDYQFSKKIHVRCPDGMFFRSGIDNLIATCGANGEWEATIPNDACKDMYCPVLPEVENTRLDKTDDKFTYKTVVRYTCKDGFWYRPGLNWKETVCERSGFWEPDPTTFICEEKACREPDMIPFTVRAGAEADEETGEYHYGSMIYMKCLDGREFADGIKKLPITCKQDAMWHPNPIYLKCTELECTVPSPLPENGFILGDHYVVGAELTVQCYDGYYISNVDREMEMPTVIKCDDTLQWEPHPSMITCKPISCEEPPDVENADVIKEGVNLGSYTQYSCEIGYWIRTAVYFFTSECNGDGLWEPDPSKQKCKVVTCGGPGVFENGVVEVDRNPANYRDVAILKCHLGFWVISYFKVSIQMECNDRGTWDPSPLLLKCVAVLCFDPGELPRSQRVISNYEDSDSHRTTQGERFFTYGTRLSYSCEAGYEFAWQQSDITTTCGVNGEWSIDVSKLSCSESMCEFTLGVVHGHVIEESSMSDNGFITNSTLKIKCNKGYWFAKGEFVKEVVCQSNNRWSMDLNRLACVRVACPKLPDIPSGTYVSTGTTATDKAIYRCEVGKGPEPQAEFECGESGEWIPDISALTCTTAKCFLPTPIPNTDTTYSFPRGRPDEPLKYGQSEFLYCKPGYYFLPHVDNVVIRCMGDNEISPAYIFNGCYEQTAFPCPVIPAITNASPSLVEPKRVVYKCDTGHEFSASTRIIELNCVHGEWSPDPSSFSCSASVCNTPLLNTATMSLRDPQPANPVYQFTSVLVVKCKSGTYVNYASYLDQMKDTFEIVCGYGGKWLPDPTTDLTCGRKSCTSAIDIPNTSRKDFGNLVSTFTCNGHRSFSRSMLTLKTVCYPNGTWQPPPSMFRCSMHSCSVPGQYSFATMAMQKTSNNLQKVHINCLPGYWMNVTATYQKFSGEMQCTKTGRWNKMNAVTNCSPLLCPTPPDILYAVQSEISGFSYLSTVKYTCNENLWFPDIQKKYRYIECSFNAKWRPDPPLLQCQPVECEPPLAIENALTLGDQSFVGSRSIYRCLDGYQFRKNVYQMEIVCQENGEWSPYPGAIFNCTAIKCNRPPTLFQLDETSRIVLEQNDKFDSGNTFSYLCAKGYWMTDGLKRHKKLDITCRNGSWIPSMKSVIGCSSVVCDIPPEIYGASLEGNNHNYNDSIAYQCARGLHFHAFKLRTVEIRCTEDALWTPDAYSLRCTDVVCDDINIPNAIRYGDRVDIDAAVIFECPGTMWLERGRKEVTTVCNEDGHWVPDISQLSCETVSCGMPNFPHGYASGSSFLYSNKVYLKCASGYFMVPSVASPPEITCSIDGTWYPNPQSYICQPIKCMDPPFIPHATFSGELTYNSSLQATCDKGYYFRVTVNRIEMKCEPDGTWSEDFNNMRCIPIMCQHVPKVLYATSVLTSPIKPPNYGSRLQFTCADGYWISRRVFSIEVQCNDTGVWDPNTDALCKKIKCPRPLFKQNAVLYLSDGVKNTSEYDVGVKLRYDCLPSYWIYARYSILDWIFTGTRTVQLSCGKLGTWQPHDFTFTCAAIDMHGVPSGIPSGISIADIIRSNWSAVAGLPTDDVKNHPHAKLIETGSTFWINGSPQSDRSTVIQSADRDDENVNKAWDGDESTFWAAKYKDERRYELTISLDRIYILKEFRVESKTHAMAQASPVSSMEVSFSKDSKVFNVKRYYIFNYAQGKSAEVDEGSKWIRNMNTTANILTGRATIVNKNSKSQFHVSGLDITAKFIKVGITGTRNPNLPPIIQEISFRVSHLQWIVEYPTDYVTLTAFTSALILTSTLVCCLGYFLDKAGFDSVHVSKSKDKSADATKFFVFKFCSSNVGNIRMVLCRLIREGTVAPIVVTELNRSWYSPYQHFYIVLNVEAGVIIPELEVGLLTFDDDSRKVQISIEAAEICGNDLNLSTLKWIKVTGESRIRPETCESFPMKSFDHENSKVSLEEPLTSTNFIRIMLSGHSLMTLFINDIFSPMTNFDATMVAFVVLSTGLLFLTILFPYHDLLGVTILCLTNTVLMIITMSLLKWIYYKMNLGWNIAKVAKRRPSSDKDLHSRGDSVQLKSTLEHISGSWIDYRSLIRNDNKFRSLAFKMLNAERASQSQTTLASMSDYNSLLLPEEYIRRKVSREIDDVSITDEALDKAADKRIGCGIRRSNSCFAVMNYQKQNEEEEKEDSQDDLHSEKFRLDPNRLDNLETDVSVKSSLESIFDDAETQEKKTVVDEISHGFFKGRLLNMPETLKRPQLYHENTNKKRVRNLFRVPNEWLRPSAGILFSKKDDVSDFGNSSVGSFLENSEDVHQTTSNEISADASEMKSGSVLPSNLLTFSVTCDKKISSRGQRVVNFCLLAYVIVCVGCAIYFGFLPTNEVTMAAFYACLTLCCFLSIVLPFDMGLSCILYKVLYTRSY